MKEKIVILGGGGTGMLMADSVARCETLELAGFLDDDPGKQADGYCGYPVLSPLASWAEQGDRTVFLSSLYGAKKNALFADLVDSLNIPEHRWAIVVDPAAIVSPTASLARGAYVGPACVVEPMVEIGPMSVLLGNVYAAHNTHLGRYVCCANSVSLAGSVSAGDAVFIGANACVREYTTIGRRSVVGMGSVVVKDVPAGTIVAGNPAGELRRRGG